MRWVITKKLVDTEYVTKARLVAKGFQETIDDLRTDSPTCMRETLKILLAMATSKGYRINSIDIKAAFLQGKPIERTIYLKPPKEANAEGKLWKLKKAVYGLSDASRVWYLRVVDELKNLGVKISKYDKALFIWKQNESVEGFMSVHVDDFFWCGSMDFEERVINKMKAIFKISKEDSVAFKYLGVHLNQSSNSMVLSQTPYIETIQPLLNLNAHEQKSGDIGKEVHRLLRGIVGQLSWACGMSRPDVAIDCCVLSTVQSKPTVKDCNDVNKAIRDMKTNNFDLKFPKLHIPSIYMVIHSDASFGNLIDGGS